MTDYEKLLEEVDRVHSAFGGGDTDIIARLAAALREVMAERDKARGVGCNESAEELRQHVASVAETCEYMGARGDAQALRKLAAEHRAALADVEAMRAQIAEATGALQYARLAATWLVNHADRAHKYDRGYIDEVLRQIVQAESALDALATPSGGKGRE